MQGQRLHRLIRPGRVISLKTHKVDSFPDHIGTLWRPNVHAGLTKHRAQYLYPLVMLFKAADNRNGTLHAMS